MNPADLIIGILVAVLLLGAVFLAVRRRRKGSCCSGGCGACRLCEANGSKKKNGPSPGGRSSGNPSGGGIT